jgi:hypothetical protein
LGSGLPPSNLLYLPWRIPGRRADARAKGERSIDTGRIENPAIIRIEK